jgi:acetylornithine deacetylase/succinyl-diaminopimelate desuccinylase-like protein
VRGLRGSTVFVAAFLLFTAGCAWNRQQVKSLRDRDAPRIQFDKVVVTTPSALNAIPAKCGPAGNHRVRPEELQVFQVVGTIARARRERDHDIHIVLADIDHPRDRLVIEAGDPDFGKNAASPYRDRLVTARRMIDALVDASATRHLSDLNGTVVRVTGVGFFDVEHFQIGRSRSCIELHPILTIERLDAPKGAGSAGLGRAAVLTVNTSGSGQSSRARSSVFRR